jgi:hypothetical protein
VQVYSRTGPKNEDAAGKALSKAQETTRHRRLLETLAPARDAIKTILELGSAVAEVSKIHGIIQYHLFYDSIVAPSRQSSVCDLHHGMEGTYPTYRSSFLTAEHDSLIQCRNWRNKSGAMKP